MKKVLMVCLGNICRSPLAEGILKDKVDSSEVYVDSAGTGGWHVGELPDKRSIDVALTHGIDIRDQRCRRFDRSDFEDFDHIFVMDRSNLADVLAMAENEKDGSKVALLLDADKKGSMQEVPDPYYGGVNGFENVFQMIDKACEKIAKTL